MRRLFILLISLLLMSCAIPDIPDVPKPVCVEGYYVVYYQQWRECTCPKCEWHDKGTYWVGDGNYYYVGLPVVNPVEIYGVCPIRKEQ